MADRLPCTTCGQDWQTRYRVPEDGRVFWLCPECEAVWLPGEDSYRPPKRFLPDIFPPERAYEVWALIEPFPDE